MNNSSFLKIYWIVLVLIGCYNSKKVTIGKPVVFIADSSLFQNASIASDTDINRKNISYRKNFGLETDFFTLEKNSKIEIISKTSIFFQPFLTSNSDFAYPGDSIIVGADSSGRVTYTSTNENRNNEFLFERALRDRISEVSHELFDDIYFYNTWNDSLVNTDSLNANLKLIDSIFDIKTNAIFDSLINFYALSPQYIINRKLNYNLSGYPFYNVNTNSFMNGFFLIDNKGLRNKITNLNITPETYPGVAYKIDEMFNYLLHKLGIPKEIRTIDNFTAQYDCITRSFSKGFLRDYLLSSVMNKALSRRIQISRHYRKKYFRECKNALLRSEVLKKMKQVVFLKNLNLDAIGNTIVNISLSRKLTIEELLESNKGNVLLIDFWASWCAPCRAEMYYSRMIENTYKNREIKFIYLSVDKNISGWQEASRNELLQHENSYIIGNIEKFGWIKKYSIVGIPRYILINKEGEIISADAPRPSDPELKKMIEKYL